MTYIVSYRYNGRVTTASFDSLAIALNWMTKNSYYYPVLTYKE